MGSKECLGRRAPHHGVEAMTTQVLLPLKGNVFTLMTQHICHICQPRQEVGILVIFSHSYQLENTNTSDQSPNHPPQMNTRPQSCRLRLTSGAVTAAFLVVL